jgi:ferredoxin
MEALRTKARELLESKAVGVVIGYGQGSLPRNTRPVFIRTPQRVDRLILNDRCTQNLAVYLFKPEVKAFGKAAIVAPPPTLRALLQLATENQLQDGQVVMIGVDTTGQLLDLPDFKAVEAFVATLPAGLTAEQAERIHKLQQMSREERWQFWVKEFSRCLRCYACRSACPMCYCGRCAVEANQPQWIGSAPHPLANFEWHVARAMHQAGRCVNCGSCAEACPLGIPLNLMTQMICQDLADEFGQIAGMQAKGDYVLATFKPDDKEDFIR